MQRDLFQPERYIIPISGKDSLSTALLQIAKDPDLPYEFMFNPTGAELPEVFEWLERVEIYLKKPIIRVGRDLETIIREKNGFLPSRINRYCTNDSKIEPMESFIGNSPCFVYYGIRADEPTRVGYNNSKPNIRAIYPLKEAGVTISMVYQIIKHAGLKPPTFFWKSVYDEVCKRVGSDVVNTLHEWEIDVLFSWRTRANCYWCFNQRKYEWVGLLEHHPNLFYNAQDMEHNGSNYYWSGADYPLELIIERADEIKEKRVKAIIKYIENRVMDDENGFIDILSVTSCGLLCGK